MNFHQQLSHTLFISLSLHPPFCWLWAEWWFAIISNSSRQLRNYHANMVWLSFISLLLLCHQLVVSTFRKHRGHHDDILQQECGREFPLPVAILPKKETSLAIFFSTWIRTAHSMHLILLCIHVLCSFVNELFWIERIIAQPNFPPISWISHQSVRHSHNKFNQCSSNCHIMPICMQSVRENKEL